MEWLLDRTVDDDESKIEELLDLSGIEKLLLDGESGVVLLDEES